MGENNALALSASYKTDTGQEITLDAQIVRDICASGNSNITDKEAFTFIELCKAHRLNPFLNEAYIVKYGNAPATIIAGKGAFLKRAFSNPRFKGCKAGVFVLTPAKKGHKRTGSMVLPGEQLLGGWAEVFIEGYDVPIEETVSFSEYDTGKASWKKMPGTMIRKVALVHALREAFPNELNGLYDSAEMGKVTQEEQTFEVIETETAPQGAENDILLIQKEVGDLMREAVARNVKVEELHAYSRDTYHAEIKDLSLGQLKEFRTYIKCLIEYCDQETVNEN